MRRLTTIVLLMSLYAIIPKLPCHAALLYVPEDYPSIQAAIDASQGPDIVWVAPGTYTENLDFLGKSIKVIGREGADSTTLQPLDSTLYLAQGFPVSAPFTELSGFTLKGSRAKHVVYINGGSPRIGDNIFRDNVTLVANASEIGCFSGNPYIDRNLFIHNRSLGGVGVFSGGATILNNTFDDNSRGFWSLGGGVIAKNNIVTNSVQFGIGGTGFAVPDYNCVFNNNPNYANGASSSAHDIIEDPLYENPIVDDYDLLTTSPCIDAGDPAMEDSDGSPIDIGAYPAVCVDPVPTDDCDLDGILNASDNCVRDANSDQLDSDSDGVGDVCDNCPSLPNADQLDTDRDRKGDACDNCPQVVNLDQADSDSDSTGDVCDNCPVIQNSDQLDSDGDGAGDLCDDCPLDSLDDLDGDSICLNLDNCPTIANANQLDSDLDGVGDLCDNCVSESNLMQTDGDNDGIGDVCDQCPTDSTNDVDGDGVCGNADNCPTVSNADQFDLDGDGRGDACDNCPDLFNPSQVNVDEDGLGDDCDLCPLDASNDVDGDGICGNLDNCPFIPNPDQVDIDHNGLGDVCENAVYIESKDVTYGQLDVEVGVYLSNNVVVQAIVIPFELRSITPGAFIANKIGISFGGRFSTKSESKVADFSDFLPKVPLAWDEIVSIIQATGEGSGAVTLGRPTPTPTNVCSGPVSSSFQVIAPLDYISPDAILFVISRNLLKGADQTPSVKLTFDVADAYGSFLIDTCCITPANHIGFVDPDIQLVTPTFTPGVIRVVCPGCCIGDPQCDGIVTDVVDVVTAIGVAFRNVPATQGPGCPAEQSDVDCSGFTDVVDVVKLISVAFRAGDPVVEYCHPCGL